jgi:hypothetical protein
MGNLHETYVPFWVRGVISVESPRPTCVATISLVAAVTPVTVRKPGCKFPRHPNNHVRESSIITMTPSPGTGTRHPAQAKVIESSD